MAISSMTGFARTDGSTGLIRWQWEVRSVNGRGLDIRVRLPAGFEDQESVIKKIVAEKLSRGNVSVNLQVHREQGASELRINEPVLAQMLAAIEVIREKTATAAPSAVELLNLKGVLESCEVEEDDQAVADRVCAILSSLREAIDAVATARAAEGVHLATVIGNQIDEIERLVREVDGAPARTGQAIRARLTEAVAKLMDDTTSLDEARVYQEAALLATKLDVEEELKRLHAHIAAARELLDSQDPVGRKFDFLAQEFNREANTLCSKSNDTQITRSGLALKAVIDQMREQVQNIE